MATDVSKLTDRQLQQQLSSKGDESHAAFAEVYRRYNTRIFAYIVRVIGDREPAEDLFQETFLRFYRSAAGGREGSLCGFLITIARNLCLNHKRDRKVTLTLDAFDFAEPQRFPMEDREFMDLLRRAIDILEIDLREPLILRVYNELSYEEIAAICGIAPASARVRVLRAKKKIRSILSPIIKELQR